MNKFILISAFFINLSAFGQTETPKLIISHLTDNFYIYTTYGDAGNGYMFPANGMYCITNEGVVLFDTPWDTTQFQPLLDSIKARHNQKVVMSISTHFHSDRTAGLDYYKQLGIKTYTTKYTDELSKENNEPRAKFLIHQDTVFSIGQYTFETFYPGKGHSPDNIVIWFENEKILYGGCFIKSTETNNLGNLSDADTDEWITSVENVQQKYGKPNYVIPGHQSWKSKKSLAYTLKLLIKYKRKNHPQ